MLNNLALTEAISFLSAVLLAATASATARGFSGTDEKPLHAFRKFYIDIAGAFMALALLSAGGPTSWTTSASMASITSLEGALSLLPIAIGLLLISLLIARHRWGSRTKKADLMTNGIVGIVVVATVMAMTSRTSAAQGFDRAAKRMLSSYCSGHSSDITEILQFTEALRHKQQNIVGADRVALSFSNVDYELIPHKLSENSIASIDAAYKDGPPYLSAGISRRTKRKVRGEFCNAVVMYLALRELQE